MIDQQLIEKFKLKETLIYVGYAEDNDTVVYEIPGFVKGLDCYMMECDIHGRKIEDSKINILTHRYEGLIKHAKVFTFEKQLLRETDLKLLQAAVQSI